MCGSPSPLLSWSLFGTHPLLGAGDQVYLCYGAYTNLQLLTTFGFLLDANPHERAMLPKAHLEAAMGGAMAQRAEAAAAAAGVHKGRVPTAAQPQPAASGRAPTARPAAPLQAAAPWLRAADCFLHPCGTPSWPLLRAMRTAAAGPAARKTWAAQLAANQRVSCEGACVCVL